MTTATKTRRKKTAEKPDGFISVRDEADAEDVAGGLVDKLLGRGANGHGAGKKDPRVNAFGVFTRGVKNLPIPLPSTSKCKATIHIVERNGGWSAAMDFDGIIDKTGSYGSLPSLTDQVHPSRESAIIAECKVLERKLNEKHVRNDPRVKKAHAAVQEFIKQTCSSNGHLPQIVHGARNGNGHAPDPGRFGDKSTSLPDGVAAAELARRGKAAGKNGKRPKPTGIGPSEEEPSAAGGKLLSIACCCISPNPWQPRKDFAEGPLLELMDSIIDNGLIEPIVVRIKPGTVNVYEIADGERRWRATMRAKQGRILAIVRSYTDEQMQEIALEANDVRQGLNPIEQAEAYQAIMDTRGMNPTALEKLLHKSQSWVSNRLRLLKFNAEWRGRFASGEIPLTHARSLMPHAKNAVVLDHVAGRLELYRGINSDAPLPSCREFEQIVDAAVKGTGARQSKKREKSDADKQLAEKLAGWRARLVVGFAAQLQIKATAVPPPAVVDWLEREIDFDIAEEWKISKGVRAGFFEYFSREQLAERAKELEIYAKPTASKAVLVKLLAEKAKALPKELVK